VKGFFIEGNWQFTVTAKDNATSGKGQDTYDIKILDKNGVTYHTAAGTLKGGNIEIHIK
jgi:hypothetical protein